MTFSSRVEGETPNRGLDVVLDEGPGYAPFPEPFSVSATEQSRSSSGTAAHRVCVCVCVVRDLWRNNTNAIHNAEQFSAHYPLLC